MLSQAYAWSRECKLNCCLCLLAPRTLQPRQGNTIKSIEKQRRSIIFAGTRAGLGTGSKILAWWPELSPLACIYRTVNRDNTISFHSTLRFSFIELIWKKRLLGHGIAKATLNSSEGWRGLNSSHKERWLCSGTREVMLSLTPACAWQAKGKSHPTVFQCFSLQETWRESKLFCILKDFKHFWKIQYHQLTQTFLWVFGRLFVWSLKQSSNVTSKNLSWVFNQELH